MASGQFRWKTGQEVDNEAHALPTKLQGDLQGDRRNPAKVMKLQKRILRASVNPLYGGRWLLDMSLQEGRFSKNSLLQHGQRLIHISWQLAVAPLVWQLPLVMCLPGLAEARLRGKMTGPPLTHDSIV